MAEFVNWDRAEQSPSGPHSISGPGAAGINLDFQPVQVNHDFDLALANIDGDDFSFWALEHFETSHLNSLGHADADADAATGPLRDPSKAPCDACDAGGFDCQKIDEGEREGHCTTCVALGITCSFALAPGTDSGGGSHNNVPLEVVRQADPRSSSSPDIANLGTGSNSGNDNSPNPPTAPKVGARFSREAVRILKAWLSTHSHRPYPTDEERENLQRQTGLNKTQIANWLANARRRSKGKFQQNRSTSPNVRGWSGAIEIPPRRDAPAFESEHLSPLQRWQNSPPENEPASVTAIASAILQSNPYDSGLNSPFNVTDDDATRSCKDSSASSFGTSPSAASFGSAISHGSRGSLGSFQQRGRRRRRRRAVPNEPNDKVGLGTPPKTFQCTFCTETFRTKHDWQRHEKSLHLSLERWICCPKGPKTLKPGTSQWCCVFCDAIDPDNAHVESHNHNSCQERSLPERTFYRKDHLRQHLRLVHNTKYIQWSMDSWKVPTPDIRSKCGFCGLVLSSWPVRVDHLAEHFKTGSDMSSWKGDWGFEPAVHSMVENAIPPYIIHDERATPLPFQAGHQSQDSPQDAYELIKLELAFYIQRMRDATGGAPSDDDMQHEACRVIYASEALTQRGLASQTTWLRDLLMSSAELRVRAQMGPLRGQAESCLTRPRVVGKDNIFEDCLMEKQLVEFVKARTLLGLAVTNQELQTEACNIVGRMEESSVMPLENIADFFLRLTHRDSAWLSGFRQRAGLSVTESSDSEGRPIVASTIRDYSQLEQQLADFVKNYRATSGVNPSDDRLRRQARRAVYNCQDGLQQTAADNSEWLEAFKSRHFQDQSPPALSSPTNSPLNTTDPSIRSIGDNTMHGFSNPASSVDSAMGTSLFIVSPALPPSSNMLEGPPFFMNGPGSYRRITRELGRFVISTMSPNNPNQHIPTDEELQHQARWIAYDDDDPVNRTQADKPEWLLRFKRSMGILPAADGDGLPDAMWTSVSGGAAGPWRDIEAPVNVSGPEPMQLGSGAPVDMLGAPTLANPGLVFVSREFEDKLVQFAVSEIASSGRIPADEALQARAKEVSGLEVWQAQPTPADDPILLSKFKAMVVDKVKAVLGGHDDGAVHRRPPSAAMALPPPARHTPERGLDAIDPGLLPALEPGMQTRKSEICGATRAAELQVAITEKRLDEIITETLQLI